MITTSLSDDSSWEHFNRLIQPHDPASGCHWDSVLPSLPLSDLIPEDWLAEFTLDALSLEPATQRAIDALADWTDQWDPRDEEPIEYTSATTEPEPPSFATSFHPMSPGVSLPGLAAAQDSPLAGDYLTNKGELLGYVADSEAVENLVSAVGHLNSASRDILSAIKLWKVRAASSDLILNYCESLLDECQELESAGAGVSAICEEVLDEIWASDLYDPRK